MGKQTLILGPIIQSDLVQNISYAISTFKNPLNYQFTFSQTFTLVVFS